MSVDEAISREGRCGAARRSRTPNLQIRSLSLYPVELWLHCPAGQERVSKSRRGGQAAAGQPGDTAGLVAVRKGFESAELTSGRAPLFPIYHNTYHRRIPGWQCSPEARRDVLLRLLGPPDDQKRLAAFDGGHVPSDMTSVTREALAWIDRWPGR